METLTLSQSELVALVREQQAIIAAQQTTIAALETRQTTLAATIIRLEQRIRDLESGIAPPRRMPGHTSTQPTTGDRPPRAKRTVNLARARSTTPDVQITHALTACPHCGAPLAGGAIKRRREVIEIVPQPVVVTEHVFLERCCPDCHRRATPHVALADSVAGRSRLGVRLLSLIAVLREELRVPLASIQRYLASVHGLTLSVGGIVGALGQVARRGQAEHARILAAIRTSPVVHADETGWREAGSNGYLWTFSTPSACVYTHGSRRKEMVDATLSGAEGTLVTDFYAAYDHYPGVQQKCWAHLWRDIRELERQYPDAEGVAAWVGAVADIYREAMAFEHPEAAVRAAQRRTLQTRLLSACQPFLTADTRPQTTLCRRVEKQLHALFTFVADPRVPATNNAAERSLRHLVVSRKISGGTRSASGTQTKLTLAALFTTWRLRGLDPFVACHQMLTSPQV